MMFPNSNQIQAKPQLKIPVQQNVTYIPPQTRNVYTPQNIQTQGVSPVQQNAFQQRQFVNYVNTNNTTTNNNKTNNFTTYNSPAGSQQTFLKNTPSVQNFANNNTNNNNNNQYGNQNSKPVQSPQQIINQKINKNNLIKRVQNYQIFLNVILGEGQYGKVHLALDERNSKPQEPNYYAVKVIPLGALERNAFSNPDSMLKKEIEVLKRARHENLICLQEIQQSTNNLYIFLDYCNGGDLRSYLKQKSNKLSEEEAIEFFIQIVKGYQALNKERIIHRDLKPENILLNDGKIKIGDFGFGRIIEGDLNQALKMSRKCTPLYGSPQILQGLQYSSKCDVWSLGIVFYELLVGKWPFFAQSEIQLIKDIKEKVGRNKNLSFPSNVNLSTECMELIQKMLKLEEKDRISWEEIFEHPLVTRLDQQEQILQLDEQNENLSLDNLDLNDKKQKAAHEAEEMMHMSIINNRKGVIKDKLVSDIPAINQKPRVLEEIKEQFTTHNHNTANIPTTKINLINADTPATIPEEKEDDMLVQPPILKHESSDTRNNIQGQSPIQKQNSYNNKDDNAVDNTIQEQMQLIRQKELNKYQSNSIDKKFLFLRNKALFANVALQNLWDARKSLNLPNFIVKGLVYACGGYYHLSLKCLFDFIQSCDQVEIATQEQFEIYKQSEYYKKTYNTIMRDFKEATNFFAPFQQVLAKELQKEVFQAKRQDKYEDEIIKEMENLITFIKSKSENPHDYTVVAFTLVQRLLFFTSLPNCELISLKSIYGVQIFSKIDNYQPFAKYLSFDFRKFYNYELAYSNVQNFRAKIEQFNATYIIKKTSELPCFDNNYNDQVQNNFYKPSNNNNYNDYNNNNYNNNQNKNESYLNRQYM